jgi:hypothetical protein
MTEQRWPGAAGDDRPADLDWLTDRFVLGELSADEEQAVVDRLADDDALAAAVARSSRLVAALQATPAASVQPARPAAARARIAVAAVAVATAVALVACWPLLAPRSGPAVADGGPREVVRLWRQADESVWPEEEPLAEDEPVDGDAVPDWMLAAVGLDATSSLEPRVQEN